MAVWWATEALPVAVTSLVPVAIFPFLGLLSAVGGFLGHFWNFNLNVLF
jgi:di/tricarboxylate transporter